MSTDSIVSVYSDTRTEYTKQLCIFLIPAYFQFFVDLLTKAKQISEPKKLLWQFQTYLNEIHDWNMEKVHNEINIINGNTGCDYLEDLLTAVFIAHTKVLTAIRLSANNKKVEITIPKVEHFLFKVLCEISKLLWSSTYLFREDISGIDRQQNYKLIEGIIGEGILQAIRSLVPVKSILKNLVNHEDTKEDKDDSDDEDVSVKKSIQESTKESNEPKESKELNESNEPKESKELNEQLDDSLLDSEEDLISEFKNEPIQPKSILSSIGNVFSSTANVQPLVELNETDNPQIINLDEKPSVSFAKYNTVFGNDNSDMVNTDMVNTDMVNTDNKSPDLEISDAPGISLNSDDFDDLNDSETLQMDDYEELA
jgi:hypothetical protein